MNLGVTGPVDLLELAELLDDHRPQTSGYAAPIVSTLVRGLVARGHRVHVFALSQAPQDVGVYEGSNLRLHVAPMRAHGRARDGFRSERRLLQTLMQSSELDVLHAHWTYEFALAAMRSHERVVVTVRDWWPVILRHHPHPYRVVRAVMQDRVLRKAPVLLANSEYTAEKVTRWYRREPMVVPNPFDFGARLPDRATRHPTGPLIGAVNNGFGKRKNVTALIRAFSLVRQALPGARLRLIGSGYEEDGPAHVYAERIGRDAGIDFIGQLPYERVIVEMRSFDVFVHPSLEESFGSTLLEAISQGTPVIAGARSGAVPWVLDQGRCGRLVDVRDPAALAAEILTALELGPAERAAIIEDAFQVARSRFSLDAVVDLHESVYEGVLRGSCGIR
jgi:L-malate glycosyltransferase